MLKTIVKTRGRGGRIKDKILSMIQWKVRTCFVTDGRTNRRTDDRRNDHCLSLALWCGIEHHSTADLEILKSKSLPFCIYDRTFIIDLETS